MARLPVHTEGNGTTWMVNACDTRQPLDPRTPTVVQSAISHTCSDFTNKAVAQRRRWPTPPCPGGRRTWAG